jgi:hypothetical protein
MDNNPYAPPPPEVELAGPAAAEAGQPGVNLSEQGWHTVTGLSRWMRIVATFYFLLGGLIAAGVLIALVSGNLGSLRGGFLSGLGTLPAAAVALIGAVLAAVFILGAIWLRRAAFHFYDGVLSNAEASLGLGFRKLRLYLILYGAVGLLSLGYDLCLLLLGSGR